jgi:sulfur carrier protein ThiS
MKITLKLYASLKQYLPAGTARNETEIEISEDASVQSVLDSLGMPEGVYKLVLLNGVFIVPEERQSKRFVEGDAFAIWPPVAGG